jgi:hypothetical protein
MITEILSCPGEFAVVRAVGDVDLRILAETSGEGIAKPNILQSLKQEVGTKYQI